MNGGGGKAIIAGPVPGGGLPGPGRFWSKEDGITVSKTMDTLAGATGATLSDALPGALVDGPPPRPAAARGDALARALVENKALRSLYVEKSLEVLSLQRDLDSTTQDIATLTRDLDECRQYLERVSGRVHWGRHLLPSTLARCEQLAAALVERVTAATAPEAPDPPGLARQLPAYWKETIRWVLAERDELRNVDTLTVARDVQKVLSAFLLVAVWPESRDMAAALRELDRVLVLEEDGAGDGLEGFEGIDASEIQLRNCS